MRRLYYIADDLPTTRALSDLLQEQGIGDWHFHVVARDEEGLGRYRIHSATPIQRQDVVHTGERWALAGAAVGLLIGIAVYLSAAPTLLSLLLFALIGGVLGAWQGGVVGLSRESYKLESFHEEIEAGRLLIMVDVRERHRAQVQKIMNMGFPRVRYCGKDTTLINPLRRPKHIYPTLTRAT